MSPQESSPQRKVLETGKQRAARIPLDYYKHPDRIQKVKRSLWIGALVLSGVCLVGGLFPAEAVNRFYSRGPVAEVHAKWDNDCNRCHTPFHALSGENWLNGVGNRHNSDAKCEACHAGPVHHQSQKMDDTASCAGCHPDHHGRQASVIRHDDAQCTSCHTNLSAHMTGSTRFQNDVSGFDSNIKAHPEFKLIRDQETDKGTIKFNHKLHMTAGLVLTPGGKPWTLENIAPREREDFKKLVGARDDKAPVQLSCEACHQPEPATRRPTFTEGSPTPLVRDYSGYMKPVKYESACKACHPLTLPGLSDPVPHGEQPAEVLKYLESKAAGVQRPAPAPRPASHPTRPLPGRPLPGNAEAGRGAASTPTAWIDEAKILLFRGKTTCGECHHYESESAGDVPRVKAPDVPEIWFKHAKFDHAKHAKPVADCRDCHARAYADSKDASTVSLDVLIPGKDNCLGCHGPTAKGGASGQVAKRYDCAECHYFHGCDRNDERSLPQGGRGDRAATGGPGDRDRILSALLRRE